MLNHPDWFVEIATDAGSAFALRINAKLHEERTPYQTIAIYDTTQFGHLMVIDGCTMVSTRDNFIYHEMLTHPALFTHPAPRRVCIIGGGDCGTLREVLKHPEVESVVQIEIDERVTRLAEQYFPELTESNHDSRATLLFSDGIRWIKDAAPGSLDLIIIDSTDPVGPAEGLFNTAFYQNCYSALGTDGILVQQSESPLYHLDIIRGMYNSLHTANFMQCHSLFFPQPIYPSGWWSAILASKVANEYGWRQAAAAACLFPTRYYNAVIHQAAFTPPQFFAEAITKN
ncbi:polyamine aminopropyltransferase [Rhodoferax sp. 4810]|uniref:Polyamine aminopropyltransferase n=1 Tax=Thiospirillum jenense TaxID=1653858 RepID=A0A839HBZ2_9GAMM|nr:polyamine aminopropyltransferase [Thiospirillum jenense]MBB1073338.1 polyamine aminopropyltransferase [Rhodoferax jenense]MBB1125690.1 polyamine aminopropyltransferase [Thiospirillum jenense]